MFKGYKQVREGNIKLPNNLKGILHLYKSQKHLGSSRTCHFNLCQSIGIPDSSYVGNSSQPFYCTQQAIGKPTFIGINDFSSCYNCIPSNRAFSLLPYRQCKDLLALPPFLDLSAANVKWLSPISFEPSQNCQSSSSQRDSISPFRAEITFNAVLLALNLTKPKQYPLPLLLDSRMKASNTLPNEDKED